MTIKTINLTTYDRREALTDINYRLRVALIRSEFAKQNYHAYESGQMVCDIFACVAGIQTKEEYWPITGKISSYGWDDFGLLFWETFDLADIISAD